jgi:hypothetical protein
MPSNAPSLKVAADPGADPRFSRALLALVAAATIAVAPIAVIALEPAGSGQSAHISPVYVLAEAAHDIGHNDWAFQGGLAGRIEWAADYVVLGLFWLGAALWIRWRTRRAGIDRTDGRRRLWLKALVAAWAALTAAGSLTLGAGLYAAKNSSTVDPAILRAADLCSPWWSCVAVLAVVGFAERCAAAMRAAAVYGALLAVLLLVPLPGPDVVKALLLAAAVAIPALLDAARDRESGTDPRTVTPDAVASGREGLRSPAGSGRPGSPAGSARTTS